MFGCLALWCPLLLSSYIPSQVVSLQFSALPAGLRQWLPGIQSATDFDRLRDSLNTRTAARLHQGQMESSVYLALQGRGFTHAASIEPVMAARQFVETGSIPDAVQSRFTEFSKTCRRHPEDARMRAVCSDSHDGDDLDASFPTVARFLYEKEIQSRKFQGDRRREFVDSLYRVRGLSSDTSFDAGFPVYLALRRLADRRDVHINRVLIVGPGLEFAPRTGLDDSIPPQSIQPYAVADALLQLGLAGRDRLQIRCADINPRVVEYLQAAVAPKLTVPMHDGPDEYRRYFEDFGRGIGRTTRSGASKIVAVTRDIASRITAERINIVTQHEAEAGYDLIIATNLFVYLDNQELALAFANLESMLGGGGFLVHNELRAEIEPVGAAAGLPLLDARMVRLMEDDRRALYDGQVTHRKESSQ